MDRQGPPNQPRYQLTRGLNLFRQRKRLTDVTVSGQEATIDVPPSECTLLAGPAGIIYRTSFSGVWRDRSRRPVKQLSIR